MSSHGSSFQRRKAAHELACLLAFAKAYWLMQSARVVEDRKAGGG
jgi:hypothetical protein